MLEDSGAQIVLSHSDLTHLLSGCAARSLFGDYQRNEIKQRFSIKNPQLEMNANNLAYVIYTSGLTGTPKGVMGLHKATVNRLCWMWEQYPFEDQEVCCQKTPFSFVDSVCEVLAGLLKGVKTVIFRQSVVKNVDEFADALGRIAVTRLVLVPSQLRAMLES